MRLLKLIGGLGLIVLGVGLLLYAAGCGGGHGHAAQSSTDAIFEAAPTGGDPTSGSDRDPASDEAPDGEDEASDA